jgi:endonuclease/exonuclease/phosphatase family metal-dependent hydrolase
MKLLSLLIFLSFLAFACTSTPIKKVPGSITVMTYNVENLFDNLDDPGKEDETYLAIEDKKTAQHRMKCEGASKDYYKQQCLKNDWSDSKIRRKMKRLADVILQEGSGPDILILEEVENLNILQRLKENYLQKANYQEVVLIEGPDKRGIDVAMLSRLSLNKKPQLHIIDLDKKLEGEKEEKKKSKKARPTRGILQADFLLPDKTNLTVFGVHFPSQGNPTRARRLAINKLNELKMKLPKGAFAIAAGDFNISAKEEGREKLFSNELGKEWLISHEMGCKRCPGTHSYRGSWSFLDAILFSKNMKVGDKWRVDTGSIRVANKSIYQKNHWGNPARFSDGKSQVGVSDHWPLAVEIIPIQGVE